MKKKLPSTSCKSKNITLRLLFWFILLLLPVISFAKEVSSSKTPLVNTQEPRESVVIYVEGMISIIGQNEMHNSKIVHSASTKEYAVLKVQTLKDKVSPTKNNGSDDPKTSKDIAKQEVKHSVLIFSNFPSSGNVFSQGSVLFSSGIVPPNLKVRKFFMDSDEVFEWDVLEKYQIKENSYTYLLSSAFQHCRITSLRAPPQKIVHSDNYC